jgi:hypothetical protein
VDLGPGRSSETNDLAVSITKPNRETTTTAPDTAAKPIKQTTTVPDAVGNPIKVTTTTASETAGKPIHESTSTAPETVGKPIKETTTTAPDTGHLPNRVKQQGSPQIVKMRGTFSGNKNKGGGLSNQVVVALPAVNYRSIKRGGVSVRAPKKTRAVSKVSSVDSGRLPPISPVVNSEPPMHKRESHLHGPPSKYDLDSEKNLPSEKVDNTGVVLCNAGLLIAVSQVVREMPKEPPVSPVVNSEPPMHRAESYLHVPPSKYDIDSENNLPSEKVDNTGVVLCNAGLLSAVSQVVSEMPKEPDEKLSKPPRAKRLRASTGKCLPNLKRTKKSSGSVCELPSVIMMPDSSSPKVIFDKKLVDSEMVESDDGSCCFVGEAVPEEEARQRWPHRYEKNHHFVDKVGIWLHYLLFA